MLTFSNRVGKMKRKRGVWRKEKPGGRGISAFLAGPPQCRKDHAECARAIFSLGLLRFCAKSAWAKQGGGGLVPKDRVTSRMPPPSPALALVLTQFHPMHPIQ